MEDLFGSNKLGELEAKIDVLLHSYRALKEQEGGIAQRLEALEKENHILKEQVAKAEGEKDIIMAKVKSILEKIEKIDV
jgi:cell division protein FtsB